MKVLILAAGRSKRMKPVADKNFLKFLGEPLIEWQLGQIWNAGFKEVVLVGGAHNIEQLRALDDRMPMQIDVVEQENLDEGMSGAALAAADLIGDEPCLVFSINDVVDAKAFELMQEAAKGKDDVYLLAKKVTEYFPGGYLRLENEGFVAEVVEKPEPGSEPSDLVNLVVHYFAKFSDFVGKLREAKSKSDDVYEVGLTAMIDSGMKVRPVEYDGFWQPVKFPWHIGPVFEYLFGLKTKDGTAQIHAGAEVSEKATVDGPVIIEEGARVMAGATVKGPCYIGRNCVIGSNTLVRESNLGDGCIVGFGTEIARSHLGDDVWTHSNYIGDSVIGNDVSFGAGTVTGNLRLDEGFISVNIDTSGANGNGDVAKVPTGVNKWGLVTGDHIRVGINTSFMPGRKIGGGSYIGAGLVIAEDIPENSFARGEIKLKISENKGTFDKNARDKMRKKL